MYDLNGMVALVTGSERGLGQDVALTLAGQGADIVMSYYQEETQALETKKQIEGMGRRVIMVHSDLTIQQDAEHLAAQAQAAFGRVDILINVVGSVIKRISFLDSTDDVWNASFQVNIMSMVHVTRLLLPGMIGRRYGRIINVSSIGSRTGGAPNSAHYAAMKGAVNSFTRSLSNEVAGYGVTVNAILPGTMISPLLKETPSWDEGSIRRMYPVGRMAKTSDVTPLVAFLSSEEARYATGESFAIAGGR